MHDLHYLPRCEKKRLVKGWHSIQVPSNIFCDVANGEPSEGSQISHSDSMRSLFATPPGALNYETYRNAITWRSTSITTDEFLGANDYRRNQQQTEKLPKTVAQVKHAYRTRARREEKLDAIKAIRKREMVLKLRSGPQSHERELKTKVLPQPQVNLESYHEETCNEENEDNVTLDARQDEVNDETQLLNLPVDKILTNAAYRNEVLRHIRQKLSGGSEILLQSDCINSKEIVNNTRLMIQTLCTLSLAYCVRDQNVVPEIISSLEYTTQLALCLVPRHQPIH
ncbi:hypothetical protein PHMEG_0004537 [Phytophthora megakarya]|uniref:Uncharacterized protein n=1 Tax=Phytophthora megakarya TaxID=4795 RepID=A0A225WVU7_9STRA|nr:hypothetical protein PHMEG_0004537 [Phytophthora megakarya]